MTVWKKPVSWSKFRLAVDCPLSLQYTIEGKAVTDAQPNYYAELGTVVQYIYELYFNQKVNLRSGGDTYVVIMKVAEKVLGSQWFRGRSIQYPMGKSEETFIESIRAQVQSGFGFLKELGVLGKEVRSEVKWNSVFRGMRMFGMLDFLCESGKGLYLLDGKGHSKVDTADPRQLLYYGLAIVAAGKNLQGGGFLYWRHGFREVDLSPPALKQFIDGPFEQGRRVFTLLQAGVDHLAATPTKKACTWCNWRQVCSHSVCARPEVDRDVPEIVTFGSGE